MNFKHIISSLAAISVISSTLYGCAGSFDASPIASNKSDEMVISHPLSEGIENQVYAGEDDISQAAIGDFYFKGETKNYPKALVWYKRSASLGNPHANYMLGEMYSSNSYGLNLDTATSFKYYKIAGDSGYAPAQHKVGLYYWFGLSVPQNRTTAVEWYERSASQGYIESQYQLGSYYRNNGENPSLAIKWLTKAASQGHSSALSEITALYLRDLKQPNKALYWMKLGASKGNTSSMTSLGHYYLMGKGGETNYTLARKWFEKAIELEDDFGMVGLGIMYHRGLGVRKNEKKALEFFRLAAEKGNLIAEQYVRHNT